jgi:hypothetical protein
LIATTVLAHVLQLDVVTFFVLDGSKIAAKIQINPEIMPVSSCFFRIKGEK